MSKSEKEKMIAGEPYYAGGKELAPLRLHAQRTCYRYNYIDPKNYKERKSVIRGLFRQVGTMFCIEQPFYCDYGFNGSATWRSSEAVSKIQKRSYLAKSLVVSSPRSGGLRQAT